MFVVKPAASRSEDGRADETWHQSTLMVELLYLYQHYTSILLRKPEVHLKCYFGAAMSFGGPGGRQVSAKPIPPERGSFPLEYVDLA